MAILDQNGQYLAHLPQFVILAWWTIPGPVYRPAAQPAGTLYGACTPAMVPTGIHPRVRTHPPRHPLAPPGPLRVLYGSSTGSSRTRKWWIFGQFWLKLAKNSLILANSRLKSAKNRVKSSFSRPRTPWSHARGSSGTRALRVRARASGKHTGSAGAGMPVGHAFAASPVCLPCPSPRAVPETGKNPEIR